MTNPPSIRDTTRRAALGGLGALIAVAARAQGALVDGATGTVTAGNFATLDALVGRNVDKVVRMDVALAGAEAQGLIVEEADGLLIAYLRGGRTQLSVTRGFTRRDGRYAVEGFYRVRYAGMHQGIEAMALEPAPAPAGARVQVTRLS